jgi:hypothetical protein
MMSRFMDNLKVHVRKRKRNGITAAGNEERGSPGAISLDMDRGGVLDRGTRSELQVSDKLQACKFRLNTTSHQSSADQR